MNRERELAEALVEAADTLVDDFDVIDFLHTLAGRCVHLLDVDAAGLMLVDQNGKLHATAASAENARLLELFELQTDAGPCVDAFRTGRPVVNVDLRADHERWPEFAEAAEATGYVSVHALPLRLRDTVIGALNLFCSRPGALSEDDVRAGQALADVATIGILAQRTRQQAELLSAQLQNALNSRVTIEQAKGVLAERRRISVEEAFVVLRDHARNHNLRISDLARDVARGLPAAADVLTDPDTAAPWFRRRIGEAAASGSEPERRRGTAGTAGTAGTVQTAETVETVETADIVETVETADGGELAEAGEIAEIAAADVSIVSMPEDTVEAVGVPGGVGGYLHFADDQDIDGM